jgi:ATP-dependent helicase/nuclease subunit A
MSEPRVIPDLAQRRCALDPDRSFIVQAPAGSGKTELLIQRLLVLLAQVNRPEEITAITFTRKAAAEMRRRVFEALVFARRSPRPGQTHRAATWHLARAALARNDEQNWNLEENTARLRIQTIDSLCASLTRQMPVLARFGAQPESVEDAHLLYVEAARNTLALFENARDPSAQDVGRLLAHLDNNAMQAEQLLAAMLQHRDHWLRCLYGAEDRDVRGVDHRGRLEEALARVRLEEVRRVRALLPGTLQPPGGDEDGEAWVAMAEELLTKDGGWRKKHPLYEELCENDPLCAALCRLRLLPPSRYSEEQWAALGAIMRLLPRAVGELKLVFGAQGKADFVEIAQGALQALGEEDTPTDLMLSLDYQMRHILVDEFQDTSFTQKELLEKLTSGWQPGDGRTLFVVGDPMQSIYRFREAEVGLFLKAWHAGIGTVSLEPLRLTANFRSQAGVVEWVNQAFARVMPARENIAAGAVTYSPSDAVHGPEPAAVTVHPFFDDDRRREAHRVVSLARAALAAPGLNPDKPSTVAILVRGRSHLREIVPELKREALAFRAIEIEPLGHRPVVQDLLALTRALTHLADRTAWLAVLRAPWCGLTLADLHALTERERTVWESMNDAARVALLSADGQTRLERLRAVLGLCVAQRSRSSLRGAVEGAWLAVGGPACVENVTDLEDAEIYLDYLEDAEVAGGLANPVAFEAGIARLYALPDLQASDRLQVMTIHKAKGLEFDTVIVPGLGAGTGRDERKLFLWMERTDDLLLAPVNATGGDKDRIYEYIRSLERERAGHEDGRLLYVAATRAKKALHLLGCVKLDKEGIPRPPPSGALLSKLWPAVAEDFHRACGAPEVTSVVSGHVEALGATDLNRLPAGWRLPVCPPGVHWAGANEVDRAGEEIEFSWAGETARHVGSVVHRWLQQIAEDELKGWDAMRAEKMRDTFREQLIARGVSGADAGSAAMRVAAVLEKSLRDERGRWLLGPQREARNELRVTTLVAGKLRHLAVDRTFVDEQGRRHIVDYKTSSHEGADVDAFLDRERERYLAQMEGYAIALAAGETRLGLYFPLLGGWREWSRSR